MAAPVSAESVLETARAVAPIIRQHAAEAEEQRRLSRPVVDAMLDAGLYGMSSPRAFGGLETDPITMFKVVEEVARPRQRRCLESPAVTRCELLRGLASRRGRGGDHGEPSQHHHRHVLHPRPSG